MSKANNELMRAYPDAKRVRRIGNATAFPEKRDEFTGYAELLEKEGR